MIDNLTIHQYNHTYFNATLKAYPEWTEKSALKERKECKACEAFPESATVHRHGHLQVINTVMTTFFEISM